MKEKKVYIIDINQKKWLTLAECAVYIGLTEHQMYYYTFKKLIPHYKRGNRCYFDRLEVDAWLKEKYVSVKDSGLWEKR